LANKFTIAIGALALASTATAEGVDQTAPTVPPAEEVPIALLVDLSSGQTLFAREADRRFMPASITKVMTVFLAFELIGQKKLSPEATLQMSDRAFADWHRVGSTMFLGLHQRVTVDQLLHGITTVSANDGAIVLAEGVAGSVPNWVAMMNAKARELGMRDSHFGMPNGWMDEGRTYVSARDLATLAEAMIERHPALYAHYFGKHRFAFNGIEQVNHDPATGVVPGADGIKTGFTNQAGYGYLGTAQRDGRRLVMVVAAVSDGRTRRKDARELLEWGFSAFDSRQLFAPGDTIGSASVQDGAERSVPLVAPGPVRFAVPSGTSPKVELAIRYEGPLHAPIARGEQVAELQIKVAGMAVGRVPLAAGAAVEKANLVERLANGVAGLL
jgi:D-alanyl-D-alanine carboxypeptidase (penicillin-binding protein 5/6)